MLTNVLKSTSIARNVSIRSFASCGSGCGSGHSHDGGVSGTQIRSIKGRQIIDSRGNPTIEVDLITDLGLFRASVPSGASTGKYEAVELRDGGSAYLGKAVKKAVENIDKIIAPALISHNFDVAHQSLIDEKMLELDGTPNKAKLGANAILGVSLAVAKAGAAARNVPLYEHFAYLSGASANGEMVLPVPSFNVINGGSHAGNMLPVQEFMILPTGASSFSEAMKMGCEVYQTLKKVVKEAYGLDATNVGDEGGFAPSVNTAEETVELLLKAIDRAGYKGKIDIGLDVAASEMCKKGHQNGYDLNFKGSKPQMISAKDLGKMWQDLANKYPLVSIEDPFDEDDWNAYVPFTKEIGTKVQVVGDDLLVTNPEKIRKAIDAKACNALLLKVNQIGSVTESIQAVKMAKKAGWGVMTSHRSGETEDNYIADLAVGLRTGQIKTGAPARSERTAKYNQLLRIEEELGDRAVYAGKKFRSP